MAKINKFYVIDCTVCLPTPNFYVEALIPNGAIFGYRALVEVIKGKQGHKGGTLIRNNWCLSKRYQSPGIIKG